MRVCVLHGAHDLRLEDRPDPALGPGQVRLGFGAGGICGSDLHYYYEGAVGDFRVREPLILGHEMAGEVIELGDGVDALRVGQRVAVNPSLPCRRCPGCRDGRTNLCRRMTFFGSAAVFPHVQGAFQERLVVEASQCCPVPGTVPAGLAAMAEPLAVCLHAVARAGPLVGRDVLIAGGGPIGQLTLLAARHGGAARVTMLDLAEAPLRMAARLGADAALHVQDDARSIERLKADKGQIDVAFEASGNAGGLESCIEVTRPGGRIVQIGMFPPAPVPVLVNRLVGKELDLMGSFRFHDEFEIAVGLIASGRIDVAPLLTAQLPMAERDEAFGLAKDRSRAMKVQLIVDRPRPGA
ncbi:MAG: L-idonate 5-dehydrogenase [Geminicoccaceae bacterium]|nr:L-idonate 5-dehydrogenase [Geminicoccaceae bacterium]